jgi:hypothetical protein
VQGVEWVEDSSDFHYHDDSCEVVAYFEKAVDEEVEVETVQVAVVEPASSSSLYS